MLAHSGSVILVHCGSSLLIPCFSTTVEIQSQLTGLRLPYISAIFVLKFGDLLDRFYFTLI